MDRHPDHGEPDQVLAPVTRALTSLALGHPQMLLHLSFLATLSSTVEAILMEVVQMENILRH